VLCLHGVNAHGGRFRRLAERLAPRFRVLAPDLRGHGRSTWEPPWGLEQHLADVLGALDGLGVERADLVGHSFGARLALELTAAAPGRAGRVALLDPVIWAPPPIALERAEAERADVAFASEEEAVERRYAASRLRSTPRPLVEEEARAHLERGADGLLRWRYCRSAVVAAYGELSRTPPPWERLRVPTLLVRGAETDVVPEAVVEMCRHELGEALEVVEVPGGHIVMWDALAETADAVERFLG
jgi:lipase